MHHIKEANIERNRRDWQLPDFEDNRQRQLCKSETRKACYNKC